MTDTPKLVEAKFGPKAPSDLAQHLRDMADQVDRGEIIDLIAVHTEGPEQSYTFVWCASMWDSLAMSAMLHDEALRRMRR